MEGCALKFVGYAFGEDLSGWVVGLRVGCLSVWVRGEVLMESMVKVVGVEGHVSSHAFSSIGGGRDLRGAMQRALAVEHLKAILVARAMFCPLFPSALHSGSCWTRFSCQTSCAQFQFYTHGSVYCAKRYPRPFYVYRWDDRRGLPSV